jgi:hypothetical protein
VRAEIYRHDRPEDVLAVATWDAGTPSLEVAAGVDGLDALLRPRPIVVDDASLRPLGSHGVTVLEPGSLEWFRAALASRAEKLGLAVRFVADDVSNGWDPASNYRTFAAQTRRLASS